MNQSLVIVQNNIITGKSGGYEIQIYNIFQHLLKKGWNVYYIADGNQPGKYEYDGFHVYTVKCRHFFSFYNPAVFRILDELQVSIVYQRTRTAFSTGNIGLRYAKKSHSKFVFSIGSPDDLIPFFLTRSLWTSRLHTLKKLLASVDTLIKDFLYARNFRAADLIISQNISQEIECRKQFGRNSVIIQSGHPVPPADSYIKECPASVCWIANVREVKQPELFLAMASQCEDLSKKLGTKFIMVLGKNIENYRETRLLQQLYNQFNMIIIGGQSIEEANQIMGRASILVNTSKYEGFSNTYIQAWMRETPVVTLHCDPDGVIEAHRLGIHSRTFDQLVKDVRLLIENENLRKEMGKNARRYAVENHDIEKSAEALNALFLNLIA